MCLNGLFLAKWEESEVDRRGKGRRGLGLKEVWPPSSAACERGHGRDREGRGGQRPLTMILAGVPMTRRRFAACSSSVGAAIHSSGGRPCDWPNSSGIRNQIGVVSDPKCWVVAQLIITAEHRRGRQSSQFTKLGWNIPTVLQISTFPIFDKGRPKGYCGGRATVEKKCEEGAGRARHVASITCDL